MAFDDDEARARFAEARVARLATVGDGQPHLVPVTFAVRGNVIVTAVDHKPKRTGDLKRLRNIEANERVSLLVDHYDEDWTRLWWVRADGRAEIVGAEAELVGLLVAKYEQYRDTPPPGPVIRVDVESWRSWSAQ